MANGVGPKRMSTIAILQPPEPSAAETSEDRVSPVIATVHGLAGSITFRVPRDMDLYDALATVKRMIPDVRDGDEEDRDQHRPLHAPDEARR